MRTPRLPVVDWTDAPAYLNGIVRFAERWNLVSARVPSHFKRSLQLEKTVGGKTMLRLCDKKKTRLWLWVSVVLDRDMLYLLPYWTRQWALGFLQAQNFLTTSTSHILPWYKFSVPCEFREKRKNGLRTAVYRVLCRMIKFPIVLKLRFRDLFNPLNPELNPICYLLALLGAHHFLHVSRIRVKLLTFRLLMSYIYIYIYIAPILDVSRSHTTTQHSR